MRFLEYGNKEYEEDKTRITKKVKELLSLLELDNQLTPEDVTNFLIGKEFKENGFITFAKSPPPELVFSPSTRWEAEPIKLTTEVSCLEFETFKTVKSKVTLTYSPIGGVISLDSFKKVVKYFSRCGYSQYTLACKLYEYFKSHSSYVIVKLESAEEVYYCKHGTYND